MEVAENSPRRWRLGRKVAAAVLALVPIGITVGVDTASAGNWYGAFGLHGYVSFLRQHHGQSVRRILVQLT